MQQDKDLYNILGVDRSASDAAIKKAYKKLALKWHPDRQGGKTDEQKKEAEEKFKEISWAYSILSDPEKKQKYDQYGITDDQQMGGGFDAGDIFRSFMGGMFGGFDDDPFGGFFGGGHARGGHNRGPQPGQSMKMNYVVGIEDLLKGIHKDVKFDRRVRCGHCGAQGGEGIETCPHCHGTGMVTETRRSSFGIVQNSHPCQYCNGTGQKIKHVCPNCHGSGFETKEDIARIDVGPGFDNGTQLYFKGKGNQSKDKNGANGDLVIELIYNFDTSKYIIQMNNIYEKIEVPYYDCIVGAIKEVILADGYKTKIKIPEYSSEGTIINTGKRYGQYTYNYVVTVKMPKYVTKTEKELLKKIQKENT